MMREPVRTTEAPGAIGPYSQAIVAAGWIWAAGQVGIDPTSGDLVPGGVEPEAHRALDNLRAVLEAAGSGLERVVRATIYLADMGDFGVVNRIYGEYFSEPYPARVCVEVSRLPKDARIEIDAVALAAS
jgi:2-iminobutanoate/2-iminopropanoate deaminase